MKRLLRITLIALGVALGLLAAWRLTAPHGVGDLYRRYADHPGVRVAFIKGYPFDDTTRVDVTTIEALDAEGWAWMLAEFAEGLYPTPTSINSATLLTLQRDDGRFLFLSCRDSSLCLVDANTDAQYDAVLRHQLALLTTTQDQP